jgi:hypothetical protein
VTWLFVERKLEEAARKGAFDRLPGPGGPVDLSENPFVPADWRLAFKLLADHRIVPEFVERRREIEAIREELAAARKAQAGPAVCRAILERLAATVEALNGALARENQFVRGSLQLPPVDVEAELGRLFPGR